MGKFAFGWTPSWEISELGVRLSAEEHPAANCETLPDYCTQNQLHFYNSLHLCFPAFARDVFFI